MNFFPQFFFYMRSLFLRKFIFLPPPPEFFLELKQEINGKKEMAPSNNSYNIIFVVSPQYHYSNNIISWFHLNIIFIVVILEFHFNIIIIILFRGFTSISL